MLKKSLMLLLLLGVAWSAQAQKIYLHCGRLIDGKQNKAQEKMTVVVEGKQIVAVQKGFVQPGTGDSLVDLRQKTVMPGFFDLHVHLESESSPSTYIDRFRLNKADLAFRSAVYARRTLLAGFTTVRDLGGSGVNVALRNAINSGYAEGPRVYTAEKSIASTGGHADPSNGMRDDLRGDPGPAEGVINGPEEARKAVRQRYKNGADVIKITATGGVLSVAKDGSGPQFTEEEIRAIVETAKDYGMITAAHAHGAEGMKRAIRAGITTIEHGTLMDDETMDLMVEHGTWYVPTITAGKEAAANAEKPGYYPEVVVPKARAIGPKIQDNFAKAYKRGVKIAFGTDAGVFKHGENAREFGYMVDAGMPPMEAIKAATSSAAEVLQVSNQLGSVEAGKMADLVAVDENPLTNIKTLEHVTFVMKDGIIYKSE
ncbi:metal-dependent hydrolase family protein [Catalinimonas alkaloidigena]|nr:amidohydrolase family protein [Catalinimonas alkaloidigena]